jgi:cobalamin biosynthesis protein CbiG
MPTTEQAKTNFARNTNGVNITDMTFATMTAGAGNGQVWTHNVNDVILLKNGTGGTATFTLKAVTPSRFSAMGITVPDKTITVAAAKTLALRLSDVFSAEGIVTIECDVAANIAVLLLQ